MPLTAGRTHSEAHSWRGGLISTELGLYTRGPELGPKNPPPPFLKAKLTKKDDGSVTKSTYMAAHNYL